MGFEEKTRKFERLRKVGQSWTRFHLCGKIVAAIIMRNPAENPIQQESNACSLTYFQIINHASISFTWQPIFRQFINYLSKMNKNETVLI